MATASSPLFVLRGQSRRPIRSSERLRNCCCGFAPLSRLAEVSLFVDSRATRLVQAADFVVHGVHDRLSDPPRANVQPRSYSLYRLAIASVDARCVEVYNLASAW